MNMLRTLVVLMAFSSLEGVVTTTRTDTPRGYGFMGNPDCGGLSAQVWDSGRWRGATCAELAMKLSELRDVKDVGISMAPDVPQMLTYAQYERYFLIDPRDFETAQENCRSLLKNGWTHPDILEQCRKTVAGVVPYGLKLRGTR